MLFSSTNFDSTCAVFPCSTYAKIQSEFFTSDSCEPVAVIVLGEAADLRQST